MRRNGYNSVKGGLGGLTVLMKLMALLSLFGFSSAQDFLKVDWSFFPRDPMVATVGDTVQFTWEGPHNIFIYPSGNCSNDTGRIDVYPNVTSNLGGAANYTFIPRDASPEGKEVFFACGNGGGIHCRAGVYQFFTVYPRTNTESPTTAAPSTPMPSSSPTNSPSAAPSQSPTTSSPSAAPSPAPSPSPTTPQPSSAPSTSQPSSAPTTSAPTVSAAPTRTPSQSPTDMPSFSPSASPSDLPSIATESPSAAPSNATETPSFTPTAVPTMVPSAVSSASPSVAPSTLETGVPSTPPSIPPTGPTTDSPSNSPSIATPSPTTGIRTSTVQDLEMVLFGVSSMSEDDILNWESVTSLYQTAFFSEGENGAFDMEVQLEVTSSSRRRLQAAAEEPSVTLVYDQIMTYRLNSPDVTEADLVTEPFATNDRRNQYVSVYLNNVGDGSVLSSVTNTSEVTADAILFPTAAPVTRPTSGIEDDDNEKGDGLSTGAIIGIVAACLFSGVLCCLFFMVDRGGGDDDDEEQEEEEEENPYIPPSPASMGTASLGDFFTAKNQSVEHAYFDD